MLFVLLHVITSVDEEHGLSIYYQYDLLFSLNFADTCKGVMTVMLGCENEVHLYI